MNTPETSETTLQSDAIPAPKKSVIVNIRVPVDYAWTLKNQAVARAMTVSDLVREKLLLSERLSLSLANPSPLEAKKKEQVCGNQSADVATDEHGENAGRPAISSHKTSPRQSPSNHAPVSGRCAHGFSVWKGNTACPTCKRT